jgi:hypothetical protein
MWLVFSWDDRDRKRVYWIQFEGDETIGEIRAFLIKKYGFDSDFCLSIGSSPLNIRTESIRNIPDICNMCEIRIDGMGASATSDRSLFTMFDRKRGGERIPHIAGSVKSEGTSRSSDQTERSITENIDRLAAKGYTRPAAKSALAQTNNDFENALKILTSEDSLSPNLACRNLRKHEQQAVERLRERTGHDIKYIVQAYLKNDKDEVKTGLLLKGECE